MTNFTMYIILLYKNLYCLNNIRNKIYYETKFLAGDDAETTTANSGTGDSIIYISTHTHIYIDTHILCIHEI